MDVRGSRIEWDLAERLLDEACDLSLDRREGFLSTACGEDEGLVEPREVVPEPPSMRGRTMGRYRISDRIGSGEMGDVYRAIYTTLDRAVAAQARSDEELRQSLVLGRKVQFLPAVGRHGPEGELFAVTGDSLRIVDEGERRADPLSIARAVRVHGHGLTSGRVLGYTLAAGLISSGARAAAAGDPARSRPAARAS